MDLQRYDIVKVKIQYDNGSTQHGVRPYVIISNPLGTKFGTIITVMPLTSKIKRTEMPVHSCIKANENNGLREHKAQKRKPQPRIAPEWHKEML